VRHRCIGRGARRGGGTRGGGALTDPAGAIRPAVEAALAVAREGLSADPITLPPHALRPYLDFARLSTNALRAIARVVDRDDAFRARVAGSVDEAAVGRAGWLWLARPDGWQDEVAIIDAELGAQADEARTERDERSAAKRLAAARAAQEHAEAEARSQGRRAEALEVALATERSLRVDASERLADAESEVARLVSARTDVVRKLKEVEARLVERSTELNALKAHVRRLEQDAKAATAAAPQATRPPAAGRPVASAPPGVPARSSPAPAGSPGAGPGRDGDAGRPPDQGGRPAPGTARAGGAGDAVTPAARRSDGADARAGADPAAWAGPAREELVRQVGRAAGGAADLAAALAALMALLEPADGDDGTPDDGGQAGHEHSPRRASRRDRHGAAAVGHDGIRVPARLPGGIFDDSPEAAAHLLRVPGALLVVDGYNVSMTGWPDMPVADQRRRLVVALGELAARTSTAVEVVFDGADVGAVPVPAPVRSLVRTRFSPPGVEADDVVLDLVAQLPPARPVIVASSDNRVRDGARRCGANLLDAAQLVAVLARR
jgi:predicted RNA-binding protein with PIN domain